MKADRTTRIEKTERVVVEEKEVNEWNLTLSDEEVALVTKILGNTIGASNTRDFLFNLYCDFEEAMRKNSIQQPFKMVPYRNRNGSTDHQPIAEMVERR